VVALAGCETLFPPTAPASLPDPGLSVAPLSSLAPVASRSPSLERERRLTIDLPAAIELAGGRASEVRLARIGEAEAANTVFHELFFNLVPQIIPFYRAYDHVGQAQTQAGKNLYVTRTNYEAQVVFFVLWQPGTVLFRTLAARRRESAAAAATETARLDAVANAALAYFELVRSYALVAVATQAVADAAELVRLEESRERKGVGIRAFVLRARTQLAERRQDLSTALGNTTEASARLVEILQLAPNVELVPEDAFPPELRIFTGDEPIDALVERAFRDRPEIEGANEEVAAREHEREGTLYGPLFPFWANYLQTGLFGATNPSMRFSQDAFSIVGFHIGPGGLLDVPLIQLASRNVRGERLEIRRLRAAVQAEVAMAKAALVEARTRLAAARDEVAASRELLRLTRDRFEKGVAIELEVLDATSVDARAEGRLVEAVSDLDRAQYELLRALGARRL
jgi:outer membrane protein TolC